MPAILAQHIQDTIRLSSNHQSSPYLSSPKTNLTSHKLLHKRIFQVRNPLIPLSIPTQHLLRRRIAYHSVNHRPLSSPQPSYQRLDENLPVINIPYLLPHFAHLTYATCFFISILIFKLLLIPFLMHFWDMQLWKVVLME